MAVISNFVIHELKKHEESDIAEDVLDLNELLVLSLAEDILNIYRSKASVFWGKHWPNDKNLKDTLDDIHEFARNNKHEILTKKKQAFMVFQ